MAQRASDLLYDSRRGEEAKGAKGRTEITDLLPRNVTALSHRPRLLHSLVPQISLTTDENNGDRRPTNRSDFLVPFRCDVFQRVWSVESEGDENDMGFGIGQRS